MVFFFILLLIPTIAATQVIETCAEWWQCPYREVLESPNVISRYVSIKELELPFKWNETEIEGPAPGRALVCLEEPMPPGGRASCTKITNAQVRDQRLKPPFEIAVDPETSKIIFTNRRRVFNVDGILKQTRDTTIDRKLLEDRNAGR